MDTVQNATAEPKKATQQDVIASLKDKSRHMSIRPQRPKKDGSVDYWAIDLTTKELMALVDMALLASKEGRLGASGMTTHQYDALMGWKRQYIR